MKKLFIIFAMLLSLILPANADVMPYYVRSINSNSIGVYQATNNIKIYQEPNENSKLLLNINWDEKDYNCPEVSASNLFVAFLPKRNLAFLTAVDENENQDWVKISFNQNGIKTGWVKMNDNFRFMSWRTFINLYGRKYGLYYMKDAPEECRELYGSTSRDSKSIGKVIVPQKLNLTSVSGNWLLVRVFDIDKYEKIGWIRWRNISGEIFLFPDIK